ncbi:hypothetical protein [Candidatus Enterovibrio escicola]|uniref:hypothetical protein n=1 Tax=Candidatus Enterovibrio escicola TaxID=1927127 RepID=UPI001237CD52|nr:hypothetical protein [Candidatus Enterovibrio escacola]
MEERKSFYLTLPSNACHDIFPENTSSDYTITLSQPIELNGPYEVALAEIMYCHTWNNIVSLECTYDVMDHSKKDQPAIYQKIKTGHYESIPQMVKEMNLMFQAAALGIQIRYNHILKRVSVYAGANYSIKLKAPMAYMLGFEPDIWYRLKAEFIPPHPCDIYAGQYCFYVYSNICESQHCGEYQIPLLRIVEKRGSYGEPVIISYNKLHYIPVNKTRLDTIKIEIKSDLDKNIRFAYGKSILKLHFRPQTSSIL